MEIKFLSGIWQITGCDARDLFQSNQRRRIQVKKKNKLGENIIFPNGKQKTQFSDSLRGLYSRNRGKIRGINAKAHVLNRKIEVGGFFFILHLRVFLFSFLFFFFEKGGLSKYKPRAVKTHRCLNGLERKAKGFFFSLQQDSRIL